MTTKIVNVAFLYIIIKRGCKTNITSKHISSVKLTNKHILEHVSIFHRQSIFGYIQWSLL